jgi:hypothetical protein
MALLHILTLLQVKIASAGSGHQAVRSLRTQIIRHIANIAHSHDVGCLLVA